jgi:5-formyltetrahydrofolate cyclo-ligase
VHPSEAAAGRSSAEVRRVEAAVDQSKAALRRDLLTARRTSSRPDGGVESGPGLLAVARALPEVNSARLVALHVSVAPEPDTAPLIDWLVASGKQVLLPVLYDDNDLGWGFAPSAGGTGLVPGRFGLRQPPVDLGPETIAGADLVICPALAVDRSGVRLGRGGGSFDRVLTRVPTGTPIWAVVYDSEVLDVLPADSHDHPVQAALTPTRFVPLTGSGATGNHPGQAPPESGPDGF